MPAQIRLPSEIIDRFVQSLSLSSHSTSNLRAASLVSHAWVGPAQRCLFSYTIVYYSNSSNEHASRPLHLRLAFLHSRPDLAKLVRSLDCLSGSFDPRVNELAVFNKLLDTFPNVITFKLLALAKALRERLPVLLPNWPQLRHLSITTRRSWSETEYERLPHPETLSAASISSINLVTWQNIVMADMLRYLARTATRETLESARLVFMELQHHGGADEEHEWVPSFADAMREVNLFHHLKTLELQMMPNFWYFSDNGTPSRTHVSALCIPSLLSLRIQVEGPRIVAYAVLRQLLQTATCPNLDALIVTFSMEPHYVEVLEIFPFTMEYETPSGVLVSGEPLDAQHQPIFGADLASRLSIFKIVLRLAFLYRSESRTVVLHDTTKLLHLFGQLRANASSIVKCVDPLQFLD